MNRYKTTCWLIALSFALTGFTQANSADTLPADPDTTSRWDRWLTPSSTRDKGRVWLVTGGQLAAYSGSLVFLNSAWYAGYERSHFHFFNDNREWNQIDKMGHILAPYFIGKWSAEMFRWAGVPEKRAIWGGGMSGAAFLFCIEVLDGFSSKWGASVGDLAANFTGSLIFISQELAWKEQRILLKFSTHPVDYSYLPDEARRRAEYLAGSNFAEKIVKDYNGFTMWASVNIASFIKKDTRFPRWLNIAAGYGAENLLGGFDNTWCSDYTVDPRNCPEEELIRYDDIPRLRQYYLSFDIDLSRIKTRHRWLNAMLGMCNILKVPLPAVEFRSDGKVRFHPVYF